MSTIVLVHGYNKTSKDMVNLKSNLELFGYRILLINLPLTINNLDKSIKIFSNKIDKEINKLKENEKIHLVGHSTGGILIRIYLTNTNNITKIGRSVLISTPNKGSKLADIACNLSKEITDFFKIVKELQTKNIKRRNIKKIKDIEVGAIAGNDHLALSGFLKGENDGRVEVKSVKYSGLKDFTVVPYNHKVIHHRYETAKLVDNFIKTGRFYIPMDKTLSEIEFNSIVDNPKLINKLFNFLGGDMLNVEFSTAGGKIFWKDLFEHNGWRLQQNKITGHCRILNPMDKRKAWGSYKAMKDSMKKVLHNKELNKEELLKVLEILQDLKERGIITEDEFNKKKKEILEKI